MTSTPEEAVDLAFRRESGRAVATLIRVAKASMVPVKMKAFCLRSVAFV